MTTPDRTPPIEPQPSSKDLDGKWCLTHPTAQSLAPSDFHLFPELKKTLAEPNSRQMKREMSYTYDMPKGLQLRIQISSVRIRLNSRTHRTGMGKMVRIFDHPFSKLFSQQLGKRTDLSHVCRSNLLAIRGKRLDSDEDIRLSKSDCGEFEKSAEEIDNISVNPEIYVARDGTKWILHNGILAVDGAERKTYLAGSCHLRSVSRVGPWNESGHGFEGHYFFRIISSIPSVNKTCRVIFSGTGLELMTRPTTIRYLDHFATAATCNNLNSGASAQVSSSSLDNGPKLRA
ncbi:hypothetical protein TNCV_558961 [Trichonephila clavipes]|nr:hypothetical protein TNCV_558961 [Trichonephila clavipes]